MLDRAAVASPPVDLPPSDDCLSRLVQYIGRREGRPGRPGRLAPSLSSDDLFEREPVESRPSLLIRRSYADAANGAFGGLAGYRWPERGIACNDGRPLFGWLVGGHGRQQARAWDAWIRLCSTWQYGRRAFLLYPTRGLAPMLDPGLRPHDGPPEWVCTEARILVSGSVADIGRELVARGLLSIGPESPAHLRTWLQQRTPRGAGVPKVSARRVLSEIEAIAALPPLPRRELCEPSPGFELPGEV